MVPLMAQFQIFPRMQALLHGQWPGNGLRNNVPVVIQAKTNNVKRDMPKKKICVHPYIMTASAHTGREEPAAGRRRCRRGRSEGVDVSGCVGQETLQSIRGLPFDVECTHTLPRRCSFIRLPVQGSRD